ncbi:MAG: hypothetical protein ACRD1L_02640, partial [Terriglobales bacterium]
ALRARACVLVWDPAPRVPPALARALGELLRGTGTPLLASAPCLAAVGLLAEWFAQPQERLHLDAVAGRASAGCR